MCDIANASLPFFHLIQSGNTLLWYCSFEDTYWVHSFTMLRPRPLMDVGYYCSWTCSVQRDTKSQVRFLVESSTITSLSCGGSARHATDSRGDESCVIWLWLLYVALTKLKTLHTRDFRCDVCKTRFNHHFYHILLGKSNVKDVNRLNCGFDIYTQFKALSWYWKSSECWGNTYNYYVRHSFM